MRNILHVIGLMAIASVARADITVFSSLAAFQSATGATSATGALPDLTGVRYSQHIGSVTFGDVNGNGFWVGGLAPMYSPSDWTTLLPGHEIAVNYMENLDVAFDAPAVYSAGFQFAEPGLISPSSPYAHPGGYPYADSTFSVTLKLGSTVVGSFNFNAPDETASFVGVWSDTAFNRMEIRETSGAIEDEYFGEFYSGTVAAPVPEPETYALMLVGLGLVTLNLRRTKSNSIHS